MAQSRHQAAVRFAAMNAAETLYEHDFHAWTEEQARLLRAGLTAEADLAHIAEEIESLGASERRELESRLKVLLQHLLKWQYRPKARSTGWAGTIAEQRDQLDTLLRNCMVHSEVRLETGLAAAAGAGIPGLPIGC
jgi:hypothetical protein